MLLSRKLPAVFLSGAMLLSCLAFTGCKKSDDSTEKTKKTKSTEEQSESDEDPDDTSSDPDPESSDSESSSDAVTDTTSDPDDTSDPDATGTTDPGTDTSATSDPGSSGTFFFTMDNYPRLDGSTSTKPLATAITAALLGIDTYDANNMLQFHKTSESFRYLMRGEADLLIVAEPAESVLEELANANFEYEMEPFASEALVFVVNVNNPVDSLTIEQIQKIYTGEITNWKEVGGEDRAIIPIQRNKAAGSQVMMEKLVMKDLTMMEAPEAWISDDMEGLIKTVKSFDNSADAIGYTPYYYAQNMNMADGLKILQIEGVTPEKDTIRDGSYPFRTAYYVAIAKDTPEGTPARILYNWILGEDGQKLADLEGYVPVR